VDRKLAAGIFVWLGAASAVIRLVKQLIGKPVNRFPTGNQFSECITGY